MSNPLLPYQREILRKIASGKRLVLRFPRRDPFRDAVLLAMSLMAVKK